MNSFYQITKEQEVGRNSRTTKKWRVQPHTLQGSRRVRLFDLDGGGPHG